MLIYTVFMKPKTKHVAQPKGVVFGVATALFFISAVMGVSVFTRNEHQSNIGSSKASAQEAADINNDNKVDALDLSTLLTSWGTGTATSDINGDGVVNIFDLSMLLSKWGTVVAVTYRMPFAHPFAQSAPFNTALATTATYESATDEKTSALINALADRGIKSTINYNAWSIAIGQASASDPIVTIKKSDGTVLLSGKTVRVPVNFVPPGCGSGCTITPDGNSMVVQPDGYTAYEFYRFKKISDTQWEASVAYDIDLRSSGIIKGVRAAGFSMANGLIRTPEITARKIPHAIAASIPKELLKLTPVSADGQVINNVAVWPARSQDNQLYVPYSGVIPMGTLYAIPPSVDLNSLGLTAAGLAVARAMQQYGLYVADQSSTIAMYGEANMSSTDATNIKNDFATHLLPRLRRVTNNTSTNVGGGSSTAQRLASPASPFDPSIPAL